MIGQDKLEKERNDAKNAVEEYLYDLRNKLCGVYEKYITEEVRASGCSLNIRKALWRTQTEWATLTWKYPTKQIHPFLQTSLQNHCPTTQATDCFCQSI